MVRLHLPARRPGQGGAGVQENYGVAETATLSGAGDEPAAPAAGRRPPARRGRAWLTPRLVELAYIALLGVLLVRLVWLLVTPLPQPEIETRSPAAAPERADLSVFSRFDPFGGTPGAEEAVPDYADAQETTLDLRLVGTTVGGSITTATIETPNGRQRTVPLGEEILSGVVLRDVLPEQAILSRNGVTETLTLAGRDPRTPRRESRGRPAPAAGPASSVQRPDITPAANLAALARSFSFRPLRDDAGEVLGYALYPGGSRELFDRSGFAEGDIVTAVNGTPAPSDPEDLLELMADLPPGTPFTVTVERGGLPLDVPVDPSRAP